MLINELFNATVPIQITSNNSETCIMSFVVAGHEFTFSGSLDTWEEDEGESWNVDFGLVHPDGKIEYELTSTGNAFVVLSAVKQCCIKLISMYPTIQQIVFTSDRSEQSRVKLYNRMLTTQLVPGWKARKEEGGFRDFYIFAKTN